MEVAVVVSEAVYLSVVDTEVNIKIKYLPKYKATLIRLIHIIMLIYM